MSVTNHRLIIYTGERGFLMLQLRNYTEEAVKLYMERWFKETDCCQCEVCRLDVMAIMLNELPPKYVVTDTGALYAQLTDFDPQNKLDYMIEMTKAVQIVKGYSRHHVKRGD